MQTIKKLLQKITGKSYIYITDRGNTSIKEALAYAKTKGFSSCTIQDQGGWMTYKQFVEKEKLEINEIKTDAGLVKGIFGNTILLINTLPAYAYLQDTDDIETKKCFIINDISGSIGHPQSKWGDIIIGSFGRWKPINLEKGGFIATDEELPLEDFELSEEEINALKEKLKNLPQRIEELEKLSAKVKADLRDYDIIHPKKIGYNVIVRTPTDAKKAIITKYCNNNNLEYTICPRYIRVLEPAVSVEVKRK